MKAPLHRIRRTAAFTLIEALIVAAILAVLAVLSVGVAGKIGERGKAMQCIHNLRHNSTLIHAALADHQGTLAYYDRRFPGYDGLWWYKMYLSSGLHAEAFSKTMSCPSEPSPRRLTMTGGRGVITLGYRYNRRAGYHDGTSVSATYPIVNLSRHPSPARVPIMADGSNSPSDNALAFDEWVHVYASHGGSEHGRSLGHYGHVLFLDGHVERIDKPEGGTVVPGDYDLKIRER